MYIIYRYVFKPLFCELLPVEVYTVKPPLATTSEDQPHISGTESVPTDNLSSTNSEERPPVGITKKFLQSPKSKCAFGFSFLFFFHPKCELCKFYLPQPENKHTSNIQWRNQSLCHLRQNLILASPLGRGKFNFGACFGAIKDLGNCIHKVPGHVPLYLRHCQY